MRSNKSFANEYGITQKNLSSNPSAGLGLNPNLNIEDEYIENLLKQVHFLNMEIKLIKEKQKENKGMGIMGLLNKDQNPVVSHAVTSNQKYTDMKSQLSLLVNTAEVDYIRLDDQNYAVKAQRDLVERLSLKEEQKNIEHKISTDKVLTEARQKMNEQLKKLKELREDHRRTGDNHGRISQEWEDLTTKTKTKVLLRGITDRLEGEVNTLRDGHSKTAEDKLIANSAKLQQADKLHRDDPLYKKLVEENMELKQKLKVTDKELFDKNYIVKEMEEKKKLSIRNKDVQAELKKQAVDESQRMKKKLADKKGQMEVRFKEAKAALEANDEVRLIKGKLARKQKQINDLRKKTEVSETNYKRLRDEVQKLEGAIEKKKAKNEFRKKKIEQLIVTQNQENAILRKAELDFEKHNGDYLSTDRDLRQARKKMEQKDEQISYLIAKEEYLHKEIKLDEGIKSIKIEQLNALANNNSGLNQTISDLLVRWQQIVVFSREPPSMV